jgi:dolichyl-phosphate-mannose-protein mannosyltransferase
MADTYTRAEIRYFDVITIKHRESKVFLHSHPEVYPLRYDDGRISSQGQQVTGYSHNDTNNHWQIIPTKALPETGRGRIVRNKDVIQLLHVNTNTVLLSHDVASPLMPTNQEFTTMDRMNEKRFNDTLFELALHETSDEGAPWKTKSGQFRLIHWPTRVSMWTHSKPLLPDWAFKQQEVNGNKNSNERTAIWYVDNIMMDEHGGPARDRGDDQPQKQPKHMNFFWKFGELQALMLQHNAGLTASHPYASGPLNWPFLISGISFWTQAEDQRQIYLIGNIVGWWTCVVALAVFVGILGADLLARRRNINPLSDPVRNRLWNSAGFFILVWGVHYFPFFLMGRQLFIHHYLPSHIASALIAGSVLSFVLSETINYPLSSRGPSMRSKSRPKQYADLGVKGPAVVGGFVIVLFGMFMYMTPLTYGTPGYVLLHIVSAQYYDLRVLS